MEFPALDCEGPDADVRVADSYKEDSRGEDRIDSCDDDDGSDPRDDVDISMLASTAASVSCTHRICLTI